MSRRQASITPDFSMKEQIEAWRTMKDILNEKKRVYEASIEEDKATLQILEEMIAQDLRALGTNSVTIKKGTDVPAIITGTTYLATRISSRVEDAEVFFNFVIENNATEFLFVRASEAAVKEYMEEHKQPPPGVVTETNQKLCFRKAQ